jgi:hypothetical protein
MTNTNPPRWSELALHVILKRRDRESIAGDLLEEYREEILPSRGPVRGQAWYLAQILSLMNEVQQGILVGVLFAGWALLLMMAVRILPPIVYGSIVRHNPLDRGLVFAAMLVLFAGAGFVTQQQTGRIQAGISAGAIGALITIGTILASIAVFDGSGLRALAVEFLIVSVALGAFCGAVGALVGTTVTAVRTTAHSLR